MNVVDKIVEGITDKLIDSEEFLSKEDLDKVFKESNEGVSDKTISELRDLEKGKEDPSLNDIYDSVNIKKGSSPTQFGRVSVVREVIDVSSRLENTSKTVDAIAEKGDKTIAREEKKDAESKEIISELEKRDAIERKQAIARAESIKSEVRKHSSHSLLDVLKKYALPVLLFFLAFKDKIVDIIKPVFEKGKTWFKNNYPDTTRLIENVGKGVQATHDAVLWVWNRGIKPIWEDVIKPTWNKVLVPLWEKVIKPSWEFQTKAIESVLNWIFKRDKKKETDARTEGLGGTTSPTGGTADEAPGGHGGGVRYSAGTDYVDADAQISSESVVTPTSSWTQVLPEFPVEERNEEPVEERNEEPEQEQMFGIPMMDVEPSEEKQSVLVQNNDTTVETVNYNLSVDMYNLQI